jgi:tryptophan synthase alpha chain
VNRLVEALEKLKTDKKKAFIAYLMAGDPDWETLTDIILMLEEAGVTAVELGVPFSDPIADGPVIQRAAQRALARGVTLSAIFAFVEKLRARTQIPILLMGYYNNFLQHGREKTLRDAGRAGVDGFIIADLPPEAEPDFFAAARKRNLAAVLLAAELTSEPRLAAILKAGSGFLYYVPQAGITGQRLIIDETVRRRIREVRSRAGMPVCIGIGVKSGKDVRELCSVADGVIVGTEIVDFIEKHGDEKNIARDLAVRVRSLLPDPAAV